MNSLMIRLNEIENDISLTSNFTSTSVENNKRVLNILNTNVKTLNTYSFYLYDIRFNKEKDNHQKYKICTNLNVYSANPSQDSKIRGDMLLKCLEVFPDKSSFCKTLFTLILAFNSNFNLESGVKFLNCSLPVDILNNLKIYIKNIMINNSSSINNPLFGAFVFYSDTQLFDSYFDLYANDIITFNAEINEIAKLTSIKKRISNCQESSLKIESVLYYFYNVISDLSLNFGNYNQLVNQIIEKIKQELIDLEYKKFSKLFDISFEDLQKLKNLLLNFDDSEKQEFLNCLIISNGKDRPQICTNYSTALGEDINSSAKRRRGHNLFKRNLVGQRLHIKCDICGCEIKGLEYLIASHIVPWRYADPSEKVDPNNGLLLCPNHDFLFDSLLISFNETGNIIFSDRLKNDDKRNFNLTDKLCIDLSKEKEFYLRKHREALEHRGWKNDTYFNSLFGDKNKIT